MNELDRRDGIHMNAMQPHVMQQVEKHTESSRILVKAWSLVSLIQVIHLLYFLFIIMDTVNSIITQASIMCRDPALGDCFRKGYKVKTGYHLVGNVYDAMDPVADPNQVPIPWTAVCRRGSGVNDTCFSKLA